MTTRRLTWPAGLGRQPRWVWVLGAVLLVRAALPIALRPIVAAQASKALHARVEIGDLDLSLLRGGIALEDVAVRSVTATANAPGGELPLVAWKRFALQVRWLPLIRRTIRLRRVEMESPRVALDRVPGGGLNLAALVPSGPAPAAEKPPASRAGWGFGVDRFTLRDGWLRFRDLTIKDMEPIDFYLDAIEVADVALHPELYGEPSRIHLEMRLDEGALRLDALLGLRDDGFALETTLKAKRLPLHRARVYIPHVGWRDLHGQLAAALVHRFETGARNEVRGQAILQDITVEVPGLEEPALTWKRLALVLPALDLAARRAAIGRVDLEGAALAMRLQGGVLLPLLATGAPGESATPAPVEATPAPAPAHEQTAPAEATAWNWSIASLEVRDSHVDLLGTQAPLEVGIELSASKLAADAGEAAPVRLRLMAGGGSVVADGSVRVAPPGFEGRVLIEPLQLPELAAATGALPPHLLQKASLAGEVTIAAGSAAPTPGDMRVQGRLALAEPWLAAADPQEFAIGARGIEVGIEEVRVPGLLAAAGAPADTAPVRLQLGELRIAAPYLQLTRTAEGLAVPPLGAPAPRPETEPAPAPAAGPPGVEIAVESLQLTEGRLGVTDQTVKPFYEGVLAPLEIEVQGLRWPELTMSRLRLEATSAERGQIRVTGAIAPPGGRLEVNGRDIALQPFNPYATTFSPYSISSGRLSLATKASFRKGRYDATSAITLHDFDLASRAGDPLFQEQFGIPLSMALALLRDVRGNIVLDLPVEADEEGTKVGLLAVVRGALRRALVNALASPLRLIGAAFGGEKGQAIAPAPITFRSGRPDLAPEGDRQLEQLAAFLAARPGIGVTLEAAPTSRDARWLREQALREELGARQGVLGALRSLPRRGARDAIRAALEARARDEEGALDPGDAETLERWLAERPPVPPERLRALAEMRLAHVEALLRERHGIGAERIARREPPAEGSDDVPAVRVTLGPTPRPGE